MSTAAQEILRPGPRTHANGWALATGRAAIYGAVLTAPLNVYRHAVGAGFNVSLFRLSVGVVAAMLVLHWVLTKGRPRLPPLPREVLFALAAFVVWLGYEAFEASRNVSGTGGTFLGQHAAFVGSIAVLTLGTYEFGLSRETLVKVTLYSAAVPLLFAVYQWIRPAASLPFASLISTSATTRSLVVGSLYSETGGSRVLSTFGDPNFLALFTAGIFILADQTRSLHLFTRRGLLIGLECLCLPVIFWTQSRTGLVLIAAYAVFVIIQRRRSITSRSFLRVAGLTAVVVGVCAALVALGPLSGDFNRLNSSSTSVHLHMYLDGLSIGLHHPVAGIGLANIGLLFAEPPDQSSAQALPFTVFAEEGIVGLLLGAVTFVLVLLPGWRQHDGLLRGLVIVFVLGIWLYDFVFILDTVAIWWVLLLSPGGAAGSE